MKIAICGGGPLGIEMALAIDKMGGGYRIFSSGELGGSLQKMHERNPDMSMRQSWGEITSFLGRSLLFERGDFRWNDRRFLEKIPTVGEYWNQYLINLVKKIDLEKNYKKARVLRVHKRFLDLSEEVLGKGRFYDLFRLVFTGDTETALQEQKEEYPEFFEKMSPDLLDSLKEPLEFFEDFDMVIQATGVLQNPRAMGAGDTCAIGELGERAKSLLHYFQPFQPLPDDCSSWTKNVAIIGSGASAVMALSELKEWSVGRHITLITSEEVAFEKLRSGQVGPSQSLVKELDFFLQQIRDRDLAEKQIFIEELQKWEDLDDFVKVKVKKPLPPRGAFSIYSGVNVTAVDKLYDRPGIYLTLEWPDFRRPHLPEGVNPSQNLLTYAFDGIIVACGYRMETLPFKNLRIRNQFDEKTTCSEDGTHPEVGFYTLGPVAKASHKDRYTLKEGICQITRLEQIILSHFSKVDL